MLWKPMTHGEDLFLLLHERVHHAFAGRELASELGFLISSADFMDYMKMSASIEFFMRCVRDARLVLSRTQGSTPVSLAESVGMLIDLPPGLSRERRFQELLWHVAENNGRRNASEELQREVMLKLRSICYMCGRQVSKGGRNGHPVRTIEHIWPHTFGGQTIPENLLPACDSCNRRKGHAFSWTTGPVLSTLVHANEKINNELRMSLGLAKVAHQASKGNKLRTLKEAILLCQPVSYQPELAVDEHHFYFELLPQVRA
ncbi:MULTISPECIES: HNH endonuclease [Stenotrophomonas]|uniref:HNH endonuclease n=1 Tax=Stenotrophomonas maltophilia group TaxID=995085 RepID=UPI0009B29E49|nr:MULTISPECIES: HNH endonuclease [Stenotrophomonas]MBH1720138.1 HNH endonuclease [Stenotrophomonas maltophilia]MBH1794047.1 HNH endonuclease [Stenotrophomonas maltophilia]MDH2065443.1 HNH endonuclease [Stenotrophomonas maltophilia]HEL3010599.1 HNH endonuclease [Stenotrophomonas maltophilia]